MKKIMLGFREGGENGGPYNSHRRIMESSLSSHFDFVPIYLPKGRMGIIGGWKILYMAYNIKKQNPDLVQIVGLEMIGFYMMLACKLAGVKNIVVAIHGSSSEALCLKRNTFKMSILNLLEKLTLKFSNASFGVSRYVGEIPVVKLYANNYLGHVYNMPHLAKAYISKDSARKSLNIGVEKFVILTTGRVIQEKGFDTLSKIIEQTRHLDNIVFVIAGNGNYASFMQAYLRDDIDSGRLVMLGYRCDIDKILPAADIFLMPSHHETLCMSLIEAGFVGIPLIASNVGGIKEIIDDNINGFLIDSHDVISFCKKIQLLRDDPILLKKMSENIRAKCIGSFSPQITEERLLEIYNSFTS